MRTKSLLLAACLSLAPLTASAALAQDVTGSGVVPATITNSAERPIGFAASAPAKGVLVVLMADAILPA
ncbi:MAG: leucyl aminopeptidase, partial [Sphingopyxis sp.]